MKRPFRSLPGLLALALAVAPACDNGTSPPRNARITLSVAPSPVIATDASYPYDYGARFTLSVNEIGGGVGGAVDQVVLTLRNRSTNLEVGTLVFDTSDIIRRSSTNRVERRQTLEIPFSIVYWLSGGGREASCTVSVQFTDDAGTTTTHTTSVRIV